MSYQPYLEAAQAAVAAAGEIIQQYFGQTLEVAVKADATPVTQADLAAETAIKTLLSQRFPSHGFYGEETGSERETAEFIWLIDPIDGTKSFVRGYPMFSTQLALEHRGEVILGVSNAPVFEECAWAVRGEGAWIKNRQLQVAPTTRLDAACISLGNVQSLAADARAWLRLGNCMAEAYRTRGYGDFYHYHLLAQGSVDVVIESQLSILDVAALALIVSEAGGEATDLNGAPIGRGSTSMLAAATRELHQSVLSRLQEHR